MRPKAAQVGTAHGLAKIRKQYNFRTIVQATDTPHYGAGKFLLCSLSPLMKNVHSIKDLFEALNRIRSIPTEIFDEFYC